MRSVYLPNYSIDQIPLEAITLDGDQHHHLVKVVRIKKGEKILILNGQGGKYLGEVCEIEKKSLKIVLHQVENIERSSESVSLACGVVKKQAMEDAKSDIGWGHQIRSYVLDQSRIKDLRTGVEVGNTQGVLDGNLDPFITESLKQGV